MVTQAWSVYRGFEIEKTSENKWHVIRNRERVYVADGVREARAWIDGKVEGRRRPRPTNRKK
jgi:hypothetical protein